MSRIGNRILKIPENTQVEILSNLVKVSGKLGTIQVSYDSSKLNLVNKDNTLVLKRNSEEKFTKMLHGTVNANLNNALIGVSVGHTKKLKITGVGYKAAVNGNKLDLALGYSHPILIEVDPSIKITCPSATEIIIVGADKSAVGQLAALIRSKRPPEPYKGKGVAYSDETIIRKAGKTAEGGKGGKK